MLLISGIQQAGPTLNPTTFKTGLLSLGMRYWPPTVPNLPTRLTPARVPMSTPVSISM